MKFSQNTPVVNPTTLNNVQIYAPRDVMAYGTAGKGYDAMVGALGQVARVVKEQQDDADAADHMSRRNVIMGNITKRLYGENGILTTGVGENAKGLSDRVTQVVQEEFQNGMKGANQRVRRSMAGTYNENMGNYQRIAAQQEGREFKKVKESNIAVGQQNYVNMAMENNMDETLVDNALHGALQLADYRAKDQGFSSEQWQAERRSVTTSLISNVMEKCMTDGNLDMASIYMEKYGHLMNQPDLIKYQKAIRGEKRIQEEKTTLDDIFSRHKFGENDYDWNAIYDDIDRMSRETKVVGGGREGHKNAWVIYDVFKSAGYDDNAIAGILGRAQQEHNFSTDMAEEKDVPGIGRVGGFGMFQWQMDPEYGGRGIRLHQWAQENGHDVSNEKVQALFALKEAQEKGLTPEALNGKTAEEVADIWTRDWEGGKPGEERRYAGEWLARIKKAAAGGGWNVDSGAGQYVGKRMDNGEVGCVEFVTKAGAAGGSQFLKDQLDKGVVSVPDLVANAGSRVIDFDESKLSKGDVIIYGDNDHAVIYDQGYRYYGNSSGHRDENGNLDPIGVHGSDYREMDGLVPTKIIKTGGSGGGGHTVNAHDSGWADRMKRLANARRQELEYRKANDQKAKLENYKTQADGLGAEGALQLVERLRNGGEDMQIVKALESHVYGRYDLTRRGNGGNGGGGRGKATTRITGESGETYTPRQIRNAQRTMNKWYKAADPNNPDEVSESLQDKADEASRILIDTGLYEGGADVEEQMKTFQQMQDTAREVWKREQNYGNTVDALVAMGWTETNAIKVLDSLQDEE